MGGGGTHLGEFWRQEERARERETGRATERGVLGRVLEAFDVRPDLCLGHLRQVDEGLRTRGLVFDFRVGG